MGVDEGDHRMEIVQSVLERRACQDEREPRAQSLDDPAGLRLPVLDALPLVEDDEVPADLLDVQDVLQDLLVVANGEEGVATLGPSAAARGPAHELGRAVGEPLDLAAPLRLQRRRAYDEHLPDADR